MKKNNPLLAWHFAGAKRTLGYDDNRPIKAGRVYRVEGALDMCMRGLHGSVNCLDALSFRKGPVLSRVELRGERIIGDNKVCARERKHLAVADVSHTLHLFALACAGRALKQAGNHDPRSVNALKVKRRWLAGKATNAELSEARSAAWAAVWAADADADAAWAAAEAARVAAADVAAVEAAVWAARAAAWAARAAAWAADADADAAAAAERKWQEKILLRLLRKHHPELFVKG